MFNQSRWTSTILATVLCSGAVLANDTNLDYNSGPQSLYGGSTTYIGIYDELWCTNFATVENLPYYLDQFDDAVDGQMVLCFDADVFNSGAKVVGQMHAPNGPFGSPQEASSVSGMVQAVYSLNSTQLFNGTWEATASHWLVEGNYSCEISYNYYDFPTPHYALPNCEFNWADETWIGNTADSAVVSGL